MTLPRLVGMVHLAALPGAPSFDGDIASIIDRAVTDAQTLAAAGFDAVMVENFGDAPFYPSRVPAVTVAGITRAAAAIRDAVDIRLGVNVLRNDGESAVAIAAVTGADLIRVNVLVGTMFTDQGAIDGTAHRVVPAAKRLAPAALIAADVFVKHAVPPPGADLARTAVDTWERGGADALVASGAGTGAPTDPTTLETIRAAVPDAPLIVGSGATAGTVKKLLDIADGVIVGSALKPGRDPGRPIDPGLARQFVEAAG